MEKTLDLFIPGEKGRVRKITCEGVLKRRLFDMGITPGVEISMVKEAPLGDPIELKLRGYELSIRKSEANFVTMKKEGDI